MADWLAIDEDGDGIAVIGVVRFGLEHDLKLPAASATIDLPDVVLVEGLPNYRQVNPGALDAP